MPFAFACLMWLVAARGGSPEGGLSAPAAVAAVRVMTFNIRYASGKEGMELWENRKGLLLEAIRGFDPDLLGTQEVLEHQAGFLRAELPGYGFAGVGRDDGKGAWEFAAIFYKSDRFEKLEEGHFWLSETPEVPGKKGWDADCTRVASWVKLRVKEAKPERVFYFFNTHFDHRGVRARLESARLLRSRIETLGGGAAVILTGDFNADRGSEPYKALVAAAGGGAGAGGTGAAGAGGVESAPFLRDAHDLPGAAGAEAGGTFHNFTGKASPARIDWILFSRGLAALEAGTDRTHEGDLYPSDHFAVTAVLRFE